MESNVDRQCDGSNNRGDGLDNSRGDSEDPGLGHSRQFGGKHGYSREMVELGKRAKTTKDKVPTKKQKVGRKVEPIKMSVPTRTDWLKYLSYLQNKYG